MISYNPSLYKVYCIYRRRYIPDEVVSLKGDTIYYISDELILTSWKALKKRPDIAGGLSAYFPKLGVKVSKKLSEDGKLVYWYNDICEVVFDGKNITMNDMLLDLLVYPDGNIRLVDSDEFAEAMEKDIITKEQSIRTMKSLSKLLDMVYSDRYDELQGPVEQLESFLAQNPVPGTQKFL